MFQVGKRGSNTYIINNKDNEAAVFDMFGDLIKMSTPRDSLIECRGIVTDIDVLSIVGCTDSSKSNLYFNGGTIDVNDNYINIYSKLKDKISKFDSMTYSIRNSEYTQLILLLRKGSTTLNLLKSMI